MEVKDNISEKEKNNDGKEEKKRERKTKRKYKNYSRIVIKQNLSHFQHFINVINIKTLRSTMCPFYIPHA